MRAGEAWGERMRSASGVRRRCPGECAEGSSNHHDRLVRMWHHVALAAVADLAPVAQAELGRTVSLDPKDVVGILNDLQTAGERANDELLAPLSAAERDQFLDMLRRVGGVG
ncbi:hypothetical protein [Streptomyces sp. NPDC048462]|uniref:hypothetical protein n=1 Tax=Streptomyces sp. NPDC048462 TaxID=3365555 RepID=UPI00371C1BE8